MTLFDDWQIGPRNRWADQHVGGPARRGAGARTLRERDELARRTPAGTPAISGGFYGDRVAAIDEVAEAAQFELLAR